MSRYEIHCFKKEIPKDSDEVSEWIFFEDEIDTAHVYANAILGAFVLLGFDESFAFIYEGQKLIEIIENYKKLYLKDIWIKTK